MQKTYGALANSIRTLAFLCIVYVTIIDKNMFLKVGETKFELERIYWRESFVKTVSQIDPKFFYIKRFLPVLCCHSSIPFNC